ncbi:MAG: hypothetical protein U1E02_26020, partial [Hydrogenophaga sp.]|nr:hypothetical protein [Hydrogenophaga sp.]
PVRLQATDEAGVDLTNPAQRLWLASVSVTPSGVAGARTLDLSGLPLSAGIVYTLFVGDSSVSHTVTNGQTANDVVTSLASQLAERGVSVTGFARNAADSWAGVLGELATRIDADGQQTASVDAVAKKLTLIAKASNMPFDVNAVWVSVAGALTGDPGAPEVLAGFTAAQQTKIGFADDSLAGDDFALVAGTVFSVDISVRSYSVTVGQDGVEGNWTSVLNKLSSLIISGENAAVTAGIAAATAGEPFVGTLLDASVDAASRSFTLTARSTNIAFVTNGVRVTLQGIADVPNSIADAGTTPLVAAGTGLAQRSRVDFNGVSLNKDLRYALVVNGVTHTVKVGDSILSGGTVALTWASILGEFKRQLDVAGVVSAVVNGQGIDITAVVANTPFTLSSYGTDTTRTAFEIPGDFVLVIPDRPVGPYDLKSTGGSLTVVNLPAHAGEDIRLGAAQSLVVVSDLNVGSGGSVTLNAGKGITLGGELIAGQLNVSAGSDLSLTTQVGAMNIALTNSGGKVSNLTIEQ